jgi:hypothetical protein
MDTKTELQTALDTFKSDFKESFEKAAKDNGTDVKTYTNDVIVNLFMGLMLGRAARRGNTAKAVYWGVSMLSFHANTRQRRLLHQLKTQTPEVPSWLN